MEDNLIKDVLRVCEVLQKHAVSYLIVGGTAVAFHGHYRMTTMHDGSPADKYDFDFWYSPSYENYFNLLGALEELGIDVSEFKNEQSPNPRKSFFTHDFDDFKVDFLPEILGLGRFNSSFSNKVVCKVGETEVYILSHEDLLKSKEASARQKDQDDIDSLKALNSRE